MKAAALGHQYLAAKSYNKNDHYFALTRNRARSRQNYFVLQADGSGETNLSSVNDSQFSAPHNDAVIETEQSRTPSVAIIEPTRISIDNLNHDQQTRPLNENENDSSGLNQAPYSLAAILTKRQGKPKNKKYPSRIRRFYRRQDALIDSFHQLHNEVTDGVRQENEKLNRQKRYTDWLINVTMVLNVTLLVAKIVAAIFSQSLSIISAVVDSAVDSASACLLFWAVRAIKNRNPYNYPGGRTRLEPIIVMILSVAMVSASVQVIFESTESLISDIEYFQNNSTKLHRVTMGPVPITVMSVTIVSKAIMAFLCFQLPNPLMVALGHDHFNDVFANTIALICGILSAAALSGSIKNTRVTLIDPIGAILVSLYIIFSWGRQLRNQVRNLSGYKAEPEFLQKITWLTLNHSPFIRQIDTVKAFHFGTSFMVEVELILPESMSLKEAHNIGQSLKEKLEKLPDVEMAFVHLDYTPSSSEF